MTGGRENTVATCFSDNSIAQYTRKIKQKMVTILTSIVLDKPARICYDVIRVKAFSRTKGYTTTGVVFFVRLFFDSFTEMIIQREGILC